MAVDAQPNASHPLMPDGPCPIGGVGSQRPNRQATCPRCASTATPTILLRTCCRRQAGRGSRDAGGRACQSVDGLRVKHRPTGVSHPAFRDGSSALRITRCQQSHRSHWSASRVTRLVSDNLDLEVAGGQGGCSFKPVAIVGRRKRTGRARPGQKQPARSSQQGAPQHLQHSFTARQIGTASNEAFASSSSGSFRFDKKEFREKKEERLAPLNFLSALALHLHVTASALHCGQIVRSSRLTLNKSQ